MGRAAGLTEAQLRGLPGYRESPAFSPRERLVLDYAVEMTRTPLDVPDALFAALRQHFTAAQLVELTATVAWENYRARFNRPFLIGAAGFSEGHVCALPEPPPAGGSDGTH